MSRRGSLCATALRTALAVLAMAPLAGAAQDAPPRPPERPQQLRRVMDPPLPVARPSEAAAESPAADVDADGSPLPPARPIVEEPEADAAADEGETPAADARTDDSPLPPPRPVVEEPEAVLPDATRRPLETDSAERAAYDACLADLDERGVIYEPMPAIDGEGRCGAAFPVLVEAIGTIVLEPAVTVRCPVARALAGWSAGALVPAAREHLDAHVTTLFTAGAYACRGRNQREDARLSEHAFANALDLTGIGFETRTPVPVEPRGGEDGPEAAFQREIRKAACAHFRTVLGPGADAYHDDHLHFDQRERRNDYRLCD